MFQVKVFWSVQSWSTHGFAEETEYTMRSKDELPKLMQHLIVKIARRYSFDCSRLDHPMYPRLNRIEILPIVDKEVIYMGDTEYDDMLIREIRHTETLIKEDRLFVNNDYDMTPAPVVSAGSAGQDVPA